MRRTLKGEEVLCFLHIPKTGGTSLNAVLEEWFRPDEICPFLEERFAEEAKKAGREALARYRLVRAHHDYSIHRLLPRPPVYITMLRDPVRRVLSLFEHIRRMPEHRLHRAVVERKLSLEEVLEYPGEEERLNNRQVRQIVGAIEGREAFEGVPGAQLVEIAKKRLEEFAFFGLTERFRESVTLLSYTFGCRPVTRYDVLNAVPPSWTRAAISDADMEAILRHNRLDLELHRHAVERFEARLAQAFEEVVAAEHGDALAGDRPSLGVQMGERLRSLRRRLGPPGSARERGYLWVRRRLGF